MKETAKYFMKGHVKKFIALNMENSDETVITCSTAVRVFCKTNVGSIRKKRII
jgi:hypothetical protein